MSHTMRVALPRSTSLTAPRSAIENRRISSGSIELCRSFDRANVYDGGMVRFSASLSSFAPLSLLLLACGGPPAKVADPVKVPDAQIVDREAPVAPVTVESTNRESVVRAEPVSASPAITWAIGNAPATDGHALSVLGTPTVGASEHGATVCFDGKDDALLFPVNPLEGLTEFTVEILLKPDPDGANEQRFLHVQEDGTENRASLELRATPEASFIVSTFVRSGAEQLALANEKALHPASRWYWVAFTYKGGQVSHAVNGVLEADGKVAVVPLRKGQMSLGARLNREAWFKGCVREIRFSPVALSAGELQRAN